MPEFCKSFRRPRRASRAGQLNPDRKMPETFRIALAQLNPTLGDIGGNAAKALKAFEAARSSGCGMLALPEMFLSGYQAGDLAMKPSFAKSCMERMEALARECADGPAVGIGSPWRDGDGRSLNVYCILSGGRISSRVVKHHLPNTEVFDEKRVFRREGISGPQRIGPARVGVPICEDAWHPDVCEALQESGAEILLVPNGSPYHRGKRGTRMHKMVERVTETGLPLVYLNMCGGQDDQVFDGGSFVLNPGGGLAAQLPVFGEEVAVVEFERSPSGWMARPGPLAEIPGCWEQDYRAMCEGLGDYVRKTGFERVLLGLSGGVDSALVAAIAADALGPGNVRCVVLPSEYTSQASLEDARAVIRNLGARSHCLSIEGCRAAVESTLAPAFEGLAPDITEENIQSRLRGLLLMALSNKFGEMLLTTGNKSEVAVGYATIYGDMSGGYNPIKDLYKTRVFRTCEWRNGNHRPWMRGPAGAVIPGRVISKPPTAELRENQLDQDSLPPYDELDRILEMLVDKDMSVSEAAAQGFDREVISRVERLVYASEYKRFQSAPGTRLTGRAFWLDRRYPIANRWRSA